MTIKPLSRRALARAVGYMLVYGGIIGGIPADLQRYIDPEKFKTAEGLALPMPSIEHTLTKCHACREDTWVGPGQLKTSTESDIPIVCYFCMSAGLVIIGSEEQPVHVQPVPVRPETDEVPRRT